MLIGASAGLLAVVLVAFLLLPMGGSVTRTETADVHDDEHAEPGAGGEVHLAPDALAAAEIELASVTERVAVAPLSVNGTIEVNGERTTQVTPLVAGRIERVYVSLGDRVRQGAPLAVVSSPEIARMHGKLHEAETRVELAERTLARVERAENRAAVLSARARLDEAEVTLQRTKRLVSLGVSAHMDLVAAETAYRTAKAEYDFQSNIALNREVQEAKAELETARVDASHIRHEMAALGVVVPENEHREHRTNTSLLTLTAPASGMVTERLVNAGAGIESGQPLFTIGDLSTVWVIAQVPEGQVGQLRTGMPAEVRASVPGAAPRTGRVDYIDPNLDEGTRTARVRVAVANPGEQLKAGMFAQVDFQAGSPGEGSLEVREVVVASEAVQRIGDRTVVFVPKDGEPGRFEVRDVEVGGEIAGHRRVLSGLAVGDRVVTRGSFTLKTQLVKGDLGGHGH